MASDITLTVNGTELLVPRSLKPSVRLIDVLRFKGGCKVSEKDSARRVLSAA